MMTQPCDLRRPRSAPRDQRGLISGPVSEITSAMLKDAFNVRHPFLRPLWRRLLITGLTGAWAGVEFWSGNNGWAAAFAAVATYLVWEFFVVFDPANYTTKTEGVSQVENGSDDA